MTAGTRRISWGLFVAHALGGIVLAFIFGLLVVSECIYDDGSLKMQACQVAKRRDILLFLLLFGSLFAAAIWAQVRDLRWGKGLAISSGIAAFVLLRLGDVLFF
ncbi:hypothetical protein [Sphingobium ummariense]|uniref:Uncharacterized protein n=1 Tax=Sphingobium ummariense RL-3 TaxID=1346791 RepID=T0K6B0_9SPHN|nr:hypothetical protein [Sphingobium ummariense]EQB32199.1 hypothetical protein M529_10375 [Sphingobium ummariense RL-3]